MNDIVSPEARSRMMSGIRGKNTKPEVAIRSVLHRLGFRFRLHARELPGRPDIVLRKHKALIFVNGCFWHRHAGCRLTTTPASNAAFWETKFARNVERDRQNYDLLRAAGWRIAIVWECEQRRTTADALGDALADWLRSPSKTLEIPSRAKRKELKGPACPA